MGPYGGLHPRGDRVAPAAGDLLHVRPLDAFSRLPLPGAGDPAHRVLLAVGTGEVPADPPLWGGATPGSMVPPVLDWNRL